MRGAPHWTSGVHVDTGSVHDTSVVGVAGTGEYVLVSEQLVTLLHTRFVVRVGASRCHSVRGVHVVTELHWRWEDIVGATVWYEPPRVHTVTLIPQTRFVVDLEPGPCGVWKRGSKCM